jgi:hypothetical protein
MVTAATPAAKNYRLCAQYCLSVLTLVAYFALLPAGSDDGDGSDTSSEDGSDVDEYDSEETGEEESESDE